MSATTAAETWPNPLQQRAKEADCAITSARTLLETVCKYIFDELQIGYEPTDDVPKLYGKTAKALKLAPQQHEEELFRKSWAATTPSSTGSRRCGNGPPRRVRPAPPAPRHAARRG